MLCAYTAPALCLSAPSCFATRSPACAEHGRQAHDQILQHLVEPPCQYLLFCDPWHLAPVPNPLQIPHGIAPQYLLFCDGLCPLSPHSKRLPPAVLRVLCPPALPVLALARPVAYLHLPSLAPLGGFTPPSTVPSA